MILDTNALSAWAEGNPGVRLPLQTANELIVPSIVIGEYYFGIRQSRHRAEYETWLKTYLPLTRIAKISHETAKIYAGLRLDLKSQGTPIPSNDTWIAALACQHDLPLLSNDAHFDLLDHVNRIAF
jgi:predicted nucleic acid-binding protein